MKKMRRLAALLLALGMLAGAAGCSGQPSEATKAPAPAQSSAEGGGERDYSDVIVSYGIAMPWDGLNSYNANTGYAINVQDKIFDKLFYVDMDGNISPRAAASWEMAGDGMSCVLHLQENSYWHDGEQVTADDWVYTFTTVTDPDYTGRLVVKLNMLAGTNSSSVREEGLGDFGLEKVDDFTIRLLFKEPTNLVALANTMVTSMTVWPEHLLKDIPAAEVATCDFWQAPVGSGPCIFVSEVAGTELTLRSNPDYYLGAPKFGKLVYRVIDKANLASSILAGEIDVAYPTITSSEAMGLMGMDGLKLTKWEQATTWTELNLNNDHIPQAVRQAIDKAIDKQLIIDQLLEGNGTVSYALSAAPGSQFDLSGLKYEGRDVEGARALLDACGYDYNTVYKMGVVTSRLDMAAIIQQNLADAGIQLELVSTDNVFTGFLDQTYDMIISTLTTTHDPAYCETLISPYWTTSSLTYSRDEELYNLFVSIRQEPDLAKQKELVKQGQIMWAERLPIITICHEYLFTANAPYVNNTAVSPYDACWLWEIDK